MADHRRSQSIGNWLQDLKARPTDMPSMIGFWREAAARFRTMANQCDEMVRHTEEGRYAKVTSTKLIRISEEAADLAMHVGALNMLYRGLKPPKV